MHTTCCDKEKAFTKEKKKWIKLRESLQNIKWLRNAQQNYAIIILSLVILD